MSIGLWVAGGIDASRQILGMNPAPKGHSGGIVSPLLETLRTGHAARWVEGGSVLDCGCGRGRLLDFLPSGITYTGLDHDAALIAFLRHRYPEPRRDFHQADLASPPLPAERRYDSIVMAAVIEHLEAPAHVLAGLARHLNPGGVMILTTPAPKSDALLKLTGKLGLTDAGAEADHEALLGEPELTEIVGSAGLAVDRYYRFLFGGNQLMVARKPA